MEGGVKSDDDSVASSIASEVSAEHSEDEIQMEAVAGDVTVAVNPPKPKMSVRRIKKKDMKATLKQEQQKTLDDGTGCSVFQHLSKGTRARQHKWHKMKKRPVKEDVLETTKKQFKPDDDLHDKEVNMSSGRDQFLAHDSYMD